MLTEKNLLSQEQEKFDYAKEKISPVIIQEKETFDTREIACCKALQREIFSVHTQKILAELSPELSRKVLLFR